MPSYLDDELELVAPNITVQVGSPGQPPPGALPSLAIPANIFSILDIYSRGTEAIGKDTTDDLISLAIKPKPPVHFLLKNYGDPIPKGATAPSPPPPPSTSLMAASPPPPPSPPPNSTSNLPDLPAKLPWDDIDFVTGLPVRYMPKDLIGVTPPTIGKLAAARGIKDQTWDPFMKSMYGAFKDLPSCIYIDSIGSCISTPYFSPQAKRHRNGVLNDGRNVNEKNTTYFWEMDDKAEQKRILTPRADGAIDVLPQPCNVNPGNILTLISNMKEEAAGIKNGKSINAFSLIFGITKGGTDNMSQAGAWSIEIRLGDSSLVVSMKEGVEEIHVSMMGKTPPQKISVKPTVGNVMTHGMGNKIYILTFIPVWNGVLISYGNPQSSDWGNTVSFVPIDENLDINTEISHIINPPPKNDYDTPDPLYIPKTVVKRPSNGRRYRTPGVRLVNSKASTRSLKKSNTGNGKPPTFTMGEKLYVIFTHCGGALKFVPIYFPQFTRYHYIYPGAASSKDLSSATEYEPVSPPPPPTGPSGPPTKKKKKKPPRPPIKAKKLPQDIFKVPTKSQAITMPIFGYQSGNFVDFRTHLCTIVRDKQAPYACFSMEFKTITPDVRVPMQVWGGMVVDNVLMDDGFASQAPPNQDGVLSSASISIPRIRSVSIQRALDGSSGSIEWDRFNPLTQQIDTRPYQEVGAIQIQVLGGANTLPVLPSGTRGGIIFTGIAYGNAEVDNPGENLVRIPLKGRESKLSAEGGIGLVNVPFFDGYDHRDAMSYMAIYGGFPIDTRLAAPFKLISSYNINNPVVDFPMGTPVLQAMDQISQYGGALYYFDRFGVCIYIDVQTSTGVDWTYPDLALEMFDDEPDHTWVRNQILIVALVAYPRIGKPIATTSGTIPTQPVIMSVNLDTYPTFAWTKMALYTIPQMVRDVNELQRQAIQIAKGQSRPRSSARCKIPGNAQIELLDTINGKWLVVSISHQIDLQRKTWSTDIGVELFKPDVEPSGSVALYPMAPAE